MNPYDSGPNGPAGRARRIAAMCEPDHDNPLERFDLHGLRSALIATQARIEKLERMVIWCLDQGARNVRNRSLVFADLVPVEHAGTTVSVLAAVEKAMGE